MLRLLCACIIIFSKSHSLMSISSVQHLNNTAVVQLRKGILEARKYVSVTSLSEQKKQHIKNAFLKLLEEVSSDTTTTEKAKEFTVYNPPKPPTPITRTTMLPLQQIKSKAPLTAAQLIATHGYRPETHTIETYDGYKLTIQRILPSSNINYQPRVYKQSVILHHGLLGSSEDWLLLGPHRALPYLLSDRGYDVWLLNARGNKYGRIHAATYAKTYDFWDFSWHEIGIYDLPAALTYVSEYTKDNNLHFIGHSMGATALLVLLSSLPEYNDILESVVLLAPLSFMHHVFGPLKYLADLRSDTNATVFKEDGEFVGGATFPTEMVDKYCEGSEKTCDNPLLLLANGGKEVLDADQMQEVLRHVPAGGSAKTLVHYMQLVKSGRFQLYDYGSINNIKMYKQRYPPKYNLKDISVSMALISSTSDWLSDIEDVSILLSMLDNVKIHHVIKKYDFGHMDFVWSKHAPELVFDIVIEALDRTSAKV